MNFYVCSTPYHLFITLCMINKSDEQNYIYMSTPEDQVFKLFKNYKSKIIEMFNVEDVFIRKRNNLKERLFIEQINDKKEYKRIKSIVENSKVFIFPWHEYGLYSVSEYIFKKSKDVILVEDGGTSYAKEEPSKIEKIIKKYIYFRDIEFYKKEKISKVLVQYPEKFSDKLYNRIEKLDLSYIVKNIDIPFLNDNCIVILTQPLSEDGYIKEEEKIEIYKKLANKYNENYNVIIKKHPREKTNYRIEGTRELDGNFPSEIFIILGIQFEKAIGICTGAIKLINAKECINIDEDFFKKMKM